MQSAVCLALGMGLGTGCSYDWDKYDPSLGESLGSDGGSSQDASAPPDADVDGSATSGGSSAGASGGQGGAAGSSGGTAGATGGGSGEGGTTGQGGTAGEGTGGAGGEPAGGSGGAGGEPSAGSGGTGGEPAGGSGGTGQGGSTGGAGGAAGATGGAAGQGGSQGGTGGATGGTAGQGGTAGAGGAAGTAGSGSTDPCTNNLLQNPGFEDTSGGFPDLWELTSESNGSGGLWRAESTITRTGSSALAIDTRSATRAGGGNYRMRIGTAGTLPVTPDEQLMVSAWVRMDEVGTENPNPGIIVMFYDSTGSRLANENMRTHTFSQFTTFLQYAAAPFTVPAGAAQARLTFTVPIDTLVYVDDVCVERVP